MKKVYLVEGRTGEYSDICRWTCEAFLSEDRAIERVKELNAWLKRHNAHADDQPHDRHTDNVWRFGHQFFIPTMKEDDGADQKLILDYTGASYDYYSVDLVDE